jgi:hypothetical protein
MYQILLVSRAPILYNIFCRAGIIPFIVDNTKEPAYYKSHKERKKITDVAYRSKALRKTSTYSISAF